MKTIKNEYLFGLFKLCLHLVNLLNLFFYNFIFIIQSNKLISIINCFLINSNYYI